MDESGRRNKLEELLTRVRERGSGLHRAVRPTDDPSEATDAGVRGSSGPSSTYIERVSSIRMPAVGPLDVASVGPGPLMQDEELDQIASRRSLDRYVESALGEDEPSVPFAEEGPGWEAEPLALDASDEPFAIVERPSRSGASMEELAREAADARRHELGEAADAAPSSARPPSTPEPAPADDRPWAVDARGQAPAEPPPLPFSPFPSDRPPRATEPREPAQSAAAALDDFGDLDAPGPQALPLDVPWETLAKQLRGRRRSGEFQLTEPVQAPSLAPGSGGAAARGAEGSASQAAEEPSPPTAPSAREPSEGAAAEEVSEADALGDASTDDSASALVAEVATEAPVDEPTSTPPDAPRSSSSRRARPPVTIAEELDEDDPPATRRGSRRARRPRLPKKRSDTAWFTVVGVATVGIGLAWWASSGGDRRDVAPTGATSATWSATATTPTIASPAPPRATTASAARPTPPPAAAPTATPSAEPSAAPATSASPALERPPAEPLGKDEGWLRVNGRRFSVYLNGGLAGSTGQWIRAACGVRHLRLAHVDPPPRGRSFPWWVDEGGPVIVPCRGEITVDVDPGGFR